VSPERAHAERVESRAQERPARGAEARGSLAVAKRDPSADAQEHRGVPAREQPAGLKPNRPPCRLSQVRDPGAEAALRRWPGAESNTLRPVFTACRAMRKAAAFQDWPVIPRGARVL